MAEAGILAPGARVLVRDEEWLVRSSAPIRTGGYAVRAVGLSELVRNHEATFLTTLDDVQEMRPEDTRLVPDESPEYRRSRLFLESLLRRTPPTDDRVYLGHQAAVDYAPYQVVPANRALGALQPRILIADGVGIGKTIEVGILLSELIKRGRGERILVVALKSILAQFQQELWARFTIPLVRLDSVGLERVRAKIPANKNPFYYFNRAIISIDTLKNDGRYRTYLEQCYWDAIVIDECHNVANSDTQRNRLASLLSRTCDSLILTSATPHNGRPESFAVLMNMLDPTAIADPADYTKEEIQGLYVRRFKKDIADQVSTHFKDRGTNLLRAVATPEEEVVLRRIKGLQFHTLNRKSRVGQKDILFKTTLLKAFLSSPAACLETIDHRIETLGKRLGESPSNRDDLVFDQQVLEMLRDPVASADAHSPAKLQKLEAYLQRIGWTGKTAGPRVIIFSERVVSLKLLENFLTSRFGAGDAALATFDGSLSDTEQMDIVEDFGKEDSPVRALLATDAAAEGVNLHFHCNHLIHFDIPWSLITLEQRNGRIDRYGQERTPYISYLLTTSKDDDVRADLRILDRLIEKEAEVHKNIGDAAALLGLHDPRSEEEHVEAGLSAGDAPETIIGDAPAEQSFLDLLLAGGAAPVAEECRGESARLYDSDLAFAKAAFEEIREAETLGPGAPASTVIAQPEFHPERPAFTFEAPDDLRMRCQFLPREAVPRNWDFLLTTDRSAVQRDIAEARTRARKEESAWPEHHLFWELHPVMQWLSDKVLCRLQRHEAPILVAPGVGKGEWVYLFQGVLSNRRSQPVVASWFGVACKRSGGETVVSLEDLLATTGLKAGLSNPGGPSGILSLADEAASKRRAVDIARRHMVALGHERHQGLAVRIRQDSGRFEAWYQRSKDRIRAYEEARRLDSGRLPRDVAEKVQRWEAEIERRKDRRSEWLEDSVAVVARPYLKLAAVFAGE